MAPTYPRNAKIALGVFGVIWWRLLNIYERILSTLLYFRWKDKNEIL